MYGSAADCEQSLVYGGVIVLVVKYIWCSRIVVGFVYAKLHLLAWLFPVPLLLSIYVFGPSLSSTPSFPASTSSFLGSLLNSPSHFNNACIYQALPLGISSIEVDSVYKLTTSQLPLYLLVHSAYSTK